MLLALFVTKKVYVNKNDLIRLYCSILSFVPKFRDNFELTSWLFSLVVVLIVIFAVSESIRQNLDNKSADTPFRFSEWVALAKNKQGEIVETKQVGAYFICDGGYHLWDTLIPPYKDQLEG